MEAIHAASVQIKQAAAQVNAAAAAAAAVTFVRPSFLEPLYPQIDTAGPATKKAAEAMAAEAMAADAEDA